MVSNARLDLPLPLGPVTTVSFPSGRSRSIPLRLFCRAPRISTQSFRAGAARPCFLPIFEPTGNIRCQSSGSQISGERGRLARCVTRLAGHWVGFSAEAPKVRAGLAVAGGAPSLPNQLRALFFKARGEFFLLLEQFLRHDAAS